MTARRSGAEDLNHENQTRRR